MGVITSTHLLKKWNGAGDFGLENHVNSESLGNGMKIEFVRSETASLFRDAAGKTAGT